MKRKVIWISHRDKYTSEVTRLAPWRVPPRLWVIKISFIGLPVNCMKMVDNSINRTHALSSSCQVIFRCGRQNETAHNLMPCMTDKFPKYGGVGTKGAPVHPDIESFKRVWLDFSSVSLLINFSVVPYVRVIWFFIKVLPLVSGVVKHIQHGCSQIQIHNFFAWKTIITGFAKGYFGAVFWSKTPP